MFQSVFAVPTRLRCITPANGAGAFAVYGEAQHLFLEALVVFLCVLIHSQVRGKLESTRGIPPFVGGGEMSRVQVSFSQLAEVYCTSTWSETSLGTSTCMILVYSLHRTRSCDETGVVTNRGIWWAKKRHDQG